MFYNSYEFWGMHLVWWLVWLVLFIWVFITPYDIPGQRTRKDSPLGILKKRYAAGNISHEEYLKRKKLLGL